MNELVELIYRAVSNSAVWSEFLARLVAASGGNRGSFLLADVVRPELSTRCMYGWTSDEISLYDMRYAASDPWNRGTQLQRAGIVCHDTGACSREEIEASPAYREFYLPRDACFGLGGVILRTETSFSAVVLMRGSCPGPFAAESFDLLTALMPHLQRAVELHGELTGLRTQVAALTSHLQRSPQALCMLDTHNRLLYANASSREIFARNQGLIVEAGHLRASSGRENVALQKAILAALRGDEALGRFTIKCRISGKLLYRVLLLPVSEAPDIVFGVSKTAIFALIIDPGTPVEPDPAALVELFQLTPTEARVAAKLAIGHTLVDIAKNLGISIETVRTHLRRTMGKTATNRQGSLISLILRTTFFRRS